jgi:hypothetical protein
MTGNDVISRTKRDAKQGKPRAEPSYDERLEKLPEHALDVETQEFISRIGIGFAARSRELSVAHGLC